MQRSSSNKIIILFIFVFAGCATKQIATEDESKNLVDYFCSELKAERKLGPDGVAFFLGELPPYSTSKPYGHLNYKNPILSDLRFEPTSEERKRLLLKAKGSNGDTLLLCSVKNKIKPAYERIVEQATLEDLQITDSHGHNTIYYSKTNADSFFYEKIESRLPRPIVKKELFCNGNKALIRMEASLEARRSSSIEGLPLNKAQVEISKFKEKSRRLVKNIFLNKIYSVFGQESERSYSEGISFYSSGADVQPDPDALPGLSKFSDLVRQYAFIVSKKDQGKIFASQSLEDEMPTLLCTDSVDRNHSGANNGFIGLDSECKFSASKALSDQMRAWLYITRKFTTVKESPSRDGSSLFYQVSFDLTPFCAYGVAVEDLKAR